MKLATLDDGTRDGTLIIVHRNHGTAVSARDIAPTMQAALDTWAETAPKLTARFDALMAGDAATVAEAFEVDVDKLRAPLPRAYQWIDGSAYLNHVRLVRRARGAEMPESFLTDPLVYQGGSDTLLGSTSDIVHATTDWGIDFEAELAVVTDDVPYRTAASDALGHIKLVMLLNDVSLRGLIPSELKKGFGFLVSKPPTAFAPFAVTPDELGDSFRDGRVHLDVECHWNGEWFGNPNAGREMQFGFHELLAHVSQTRPLGAGTILGSGTISNEQRDNGSCCVAEKRMIEKIETGEFITPFMQFGDTVHIEVKKDGASVFGAISQKVVEGNIPTPGGR